MNSNEFFTVSERDPPRADFQIGTVIDATMASNSQMASLVNSHAASVDRLAVRDEGGLYWPADQLFRDYGSRFAYLNKPAYFEQYWDACAWANQEIAATTTEPGRASPLDPEKVGRIAFPAWALPSKAARVTMP